MEQSEPTKLTPTEIGNFNLPDFIVKKTVTLFICKECLISTMSKYEMRQHLKEVHSTNG